MGIPFYGKPGHSWFLGKDIASNSFDDRFGGRLVVHLLIVILIVDVVADANEFAAVVGTGE